MGESLEDFGPEFFEALIAAVDVMLLLAISSFDS